MSQIRPPDTTDNWVMLGFESGEFPTVAIFTDDSTSDFRSTGTPLQRRIMALRLRYLADLLETDKTIEDMPYMDIRPGTTTLEIDAKGLRRIYLDQI